MNWLIAFFTSSIGRKLTIALTGLFLCTFLVIHLLGNLQLLLGDGVAEKFNQYTYDMTHNKLIKIASFVTYFSILYHAFGGLMITLKNRSSRPQGYAVQKGGANSTWSSRNMAFLGTVVLVYIVVHLGNFWYKLKFGAMPPVDANGMEDMYTVVKEAFSQLWLVALYVVSMAALGFHLIHGFQSGFQTIGLNHPKYTPLIKQTGTVLFGILIPLGFAAIPVVMYIQQLS